MRGGRIPTNYLPRSHNGICPHKKSTTDVRKRFMSWFGTSHAPCILALNTHLVTALLRNLSLLQPPTLPAPLISDKSLSRTPPRRPRCFSSTSSHLGKLYCNRCDCGRFLAHTDTYNPQVVYSIIVLELNSGASSWNKAEHWNRDTCAFCCLACARYKRCN